MPVTPDFIPFPRIITTMARRLERPDSPVTEFPGNIRLQKQWDVALQVITSPKGNSHDEPQSPMWRKRIRHEEQPDSGTAGGDASEVVYDTLLTSTNTKAEGTRISFCTTRNMQPRKAPAIILLAPEKSATMAILYQGIPP